MTQEHKQKQVKWREKLYETKSFVVPNGGDIKKVEITYEDWLWLEDFISTIRKEAKRAERERIFKEMSEKRISYGVTEDRQYERGVNDTVKDLWLILGATLNQRGDYTLTPQEDNKHE